MCDVLKEVVLTFVQGFALLHPKVRFEKGDQSTTPGGKSLFRADITVASTNTLSAAITLTKDQTTRMNVYFFFLCAMPGS